MRARICSGSISLDIDLSDIFSEIDDADLKAECVRRGLLPPPPAAGTTSGRSRPSVILEGDELAEVAILARCGDAEGAMQHLERLLPRDLRVFSDKLQGVRPC